MSTRAYGTPTAEASSPDYLPYGSVHEHAQEATRPTFYCMRRWVSWTLTRATARLVSRYTRRCCARAQRTTRTRVMATAAARWPARRAALRTSLGSCRGASSARWESRQPTLTWAPSPTKSTRPSQTVCILLPSKVFASFVILFV